MATLSRLALSEDEVTRCEKELAKMMGVFETLLALTPAPTDASGGRSDVSFYEAQQGAQKESKQEVTKKYAPPLRPDLPQNRIQPQDFLKQLPEREGTFARVPAILTPST
jgi:Asp-tRNA(Asn)/Glu-tRNA(Gln) amidotransferase C subunit